jgi:hypothetical protein
MLFISIAGAAIKQAAITSANNPTFLKKEITYDS